jgi:hypothetical protein
MGWQGMPVAFDAPQEADQQAYTGIGAWAGSPLWMRGITALVRSRQPLVSGLRRGKLRYAASEAYSKKTRMEELYGLARQTVNL